MARMIPEKLPSSADISPAERKVFEHFMASTDTDGWVVIHSLPLAANTGQIDGEIDFVVLAPDLGVFALEVKGGRIAFERGCWTSTDRTNTAHQIADPFRQARSGMYALLDFSKEMAANGLTRHLTLDSAVVFPDVEWPYDDSSLHYETWQVFDRSDMMVSPRSWIERLARGSVQKWAVTYPTRSMRNVPTLHDVEILSEALSPDHLASALFLADIISTVEGELIALTKAQMKVVTAALENERLLVQGAAGTGKTVLALDLARRMKTKGERVGFFCFNVKLARHLVHEGGDILEQGGKTAIYEYLEERLGKRLSHRLPIDDGAGQGAFDSFLSECRALLKKEKPVFDFLVLDEAQDLMEYKYLAILDLLLVGGLEKGHWAFFGDFKHQQLFGEKSKELSFAPFRPAYARLSLPDNCRNTDKICRFIEETFSIGYENTSDVPEGPEVAFIPWSGAENLVAAVEHTIEDLRTQGVKDSDIVVLVPKRKIRDWMHEHGSSAYRCEEYDIPHHSYSGLSISTVQAFKGLESPVILLIGVESYAKYREVLYVGMSRAKVALYVFENKQAEMERADGGMKGQMAP